LKCEPQGEQKNKKERTLIMKKLNRVLSFALASVMACGMFATSAFARNDDPATSLTVYKTVSIAKDSTIPEETFTVKMRPATSEEIAKTTTDGKVNGQAVEIGPQLLQEFTGTEEDKVSGKTYTTIGEGDNAKTYLVDDTRTYTFGSSDSTATATENDNTKSEVTKDASFDLTELAFTHTGIYRYYIEEVIPTTTDDEGNATVANAGYITYDSTIYQVDLYVYDYGTKGYGVGDMTIRKMNSNYVSESTKPQNVTFKNYISVCDVKISKTVVGEAYDDKPFTFYIRIPAGGDTIKLVKDQTINAEIWDANGKVDDCDITVKADQTGDVSTLDFTDSTIAQKFELEDGQYLKIVGAPVSMIYFVEEANVTAQGYTQTYRYTETGSRQTNTLANNTAESDATGSAAVVNNKSVVVKGTVNTMQNKVEFINTRNITVDTGITMDVIPYVLVLLAAVSGGILFVFKKRRTNR
jgi:hypothetical protein